MTSARELAGAIEDEALREALARFGARVIDEAARRLSGGEAAFVFTRDSTGPSRHCELRKMLCIFLGEATQGRITRPWVASSQGLLAMRGRRQFLASASPRSDGGGFSSALSC